MTEHTPSPKELAREKLRARAARISRMRKRVVAVSMAIFAVAFGAIAYDGSMGNTAPATSGTQTTASASTRSDDATASSDETTTSSDDSSDDSTSSDDSSGSSTSSAGSSPSAVTTSQS
jgi:hypothetical protein